MPPIASYGPPSGWIEKQDQIQRELHRFRTELDDVESTQPGPRRHREILSCIHENLFTPGFNVTALRRECELGNNNAGSHFRRIEGVTIRRYIEELRMQAAKRLLVEDEVEIYLIAGSVGYEHTETFFRAFRRRFGCTPTECRQTLKKERQEEAQG